MNDDTLWRCRLEDEAITAAFGKRLVAALPAGAFAIALAGPLGAGKSTLVRAVLRELGIAGPVPSPTYTLVEPYASTRGPVYHVDLYRLQAEAEVANLGLDEVAEEGALVLVEWPERGAQGSVVFDLAIDIEYAGTERELRARALTPPGAAALQHLRSGA